MSSALHKGETMKSIIRQRWAWKKLFSKSSIGDIYSKEELQLLIRYEKARTDRENGSFSLVVYHSGGKATRFRGNIRRLSLNLKKHVRSTDHIGWLDNSRLAVLLPATTSAQAKVFADKVTSVQRAVGSDIESYIYTYPEYRLYPDEKGEEDIHHTIWEIFPKLDNHPQEPEAENAMAAKLLQKENYIPPRDRRIFRRLLVSGYIPPWKRLLDIIGSVLMLILASPIMLFTAVLIKIVSPGPIFFVQKRVGLNGKVFPFYKFRSMHSGNNQVAHSAHALNFIQNGGSMTKLDAVDSRIIPGGKIIRKLCIDELPQLFNIIKGDMSLVGPRPCIPYEAEVYQRWHKSRFDLLPGLTGLWQVSGKNKLSFQEMIRLDISYGRNISLWNDVKIIFMTVPAIIEMVRDSLKARMDNAELNRADHRAG